MYVKMSPTSAEELALLDLERTTKGASKQRRDQINAEIGIIRDLLPLPESARQRLAQLQIMSLSCVYIRKCNVLKKFLSITDQCMDLLGFDFFQAISGFMLVTTREGKLIYISENVTEYLGHSMVDMKTQGDSLYDIVDKRDHPAVQSQLMPGTKEAADLSDDVTFFCRMNMSRNLKRQAGLGDVKIMHVKGHFVPVPGEESNTDNYVFMAICTPLITPDVKESLIQNNTMVFKTVHKLDMSLLEITQNGEFHLGVNNAEIKGLSWYSLLHPDDILEAREKHVQLIKSKHEMGCSMTVRLLKTSLEMVWVNIVMQVRQAVVPGSDEPVVICTNQVISEKEAYQFKTQTHLFSSYPRSPELGCNQYWSNDEIVLHQRRSQTFHGVPPSVLPNMPYFDYNFPDCTPVLPSQTVPAYPRRGDTLPVLGIQNGHGGQVGHPDTLKALKRKLQVSSNTPCKQRKIHRMSRVHDGGPGAYSSPTPSSTNLRVDSNVYRNTTGGIVEIPVIDRCCGPQVICAPTFNSGLHCVNMKSEQLSPVLLKVEPNMNDDAVVPCQSVPDSYIAPDPSPVSSPDPCLTKDRKPIVLQPTTVKLKQPPQRSNSSTRQKDLPRFDANFVQSFFDNIGISFEDGKHIIDIPRQEEPCDARTITPHPHDKENYPVIDMNDIEEFLDAIVLPEPQANKLDTEFLEEQLAILSRIPCLQFGNCSPDSREMEVYSDVSDEDTTVSPLSSHSMSDDFVPGKIKKEKPSSYQECGDVVHVDEFYQLGELLSTLTSDDIVSYSKDSQ